MRKRPVRLQFLSLEDRLAPATFAVTITNDSGVGSLRAAIASANTTAGADIISFAIGTGQKTIALLSALPDITDAVTIDGTSQPGFAGSPLIRLDGSGAGAGSNGLNLVNHFQSTVKSLVLGGFSGAGIRIFGGGSHTILGSHIGTNAAGTAAHANGTGVLIENASITNRIGGGGTNERNIISGNTGFGIRSEGSSVATISGNFIGTDAAGNLAIANGGGGIRLANGSNGNTVGGVSPGTGNVIAGNAVGGILITDPLTSANALVGNRIGLNFGGSALANAGPGIRFSNGAGSAPPGGIAAGTENAVRNNTIAKNSGAGVAVLDTSRQVRIETNSIRDNGGLGIQVDATANAGLQAPTITGIKAITGGQTVSGTFGALANTKYTISIFTNSVADPSGFGEGQTFVGTATATTNGSGAGTFSFLIPSGTAGLFASATATHTDLGDTSAFSNTFVRPDAQFTPASFAVGGGSGGSPTVIYTDPSGFVARTANYFDASFTGGTRVATADLTGDGIPDLAIGTGVGTTAEIRVLNGATQAVLFTLNPFGSFSRGVFVAFGDVNADGTPDLAVTPDEGGGPRVRLFNGKNFTQIADFFGIEDANFRGGARPAIGDLNNDTFGDVIVSAGFGGGPRIAAFSGITLGPAGGPKLFGDFFGFEPVLRNGAFVAMGDMNGDGFAEMILAAGPGGGPRVKILNGKVLFESLGQTQTTLADFFSGDVDGRGGVRIMSRDLSGDGRSDLVTGSASGAAIIVYSGNALVGGNTTPTNTFEVLPSRSGGMFVG